jgi:hypothetical protein
MTAQSLHGETSWAVIDRPYSCISPHSGELMAIGLLLRITGPVFDWKGAVMSIFKVVMVTAVLSIFALPGHCKCTTRWNHRIGYVH